MSDAQDRADLRRDRLLRRRLLQALHAVAGCPGDGWCDGPFLHELAAAALPGPWPFASDAHVVGLARGLVRSGYARARRVADDGGPTDLRAWAFRITRHGGALMLGLLGPDPLVDDPGPPEPVARRAGPIERV